MEIRLIDFLNSNFRPIEKPNSTRLRRLPSCLIIGVRKVNYGSFREIERERERERETKRERKR